MIFGGDDARGEHALGGSGRVADEAEERAQAAGASESSGEEAGDGTGSNEEAVAGVHGGVV